MLHYSLRQGLSSGPETLVKLIGLLPKDAFDRQLAPGRFTPREAMAHLVDVEPLLLARLKMGVEQPGSTVPLIDEDALAAIGGYGATDPLEMAVRYQQLRAETVAYVEALTDEDLARVFNHPETGPLTVREQVWIFLGHDEYHIAHLAEYL